MSTAIDSDYKRRTVVLDWRLLTENAIDDYYVIDNPLPDDVRVLDVRKNSNFFYVSVWSDSFEPTEGVPLEHDLKLTPGGTAQFPFLRQVKSVLSRNEKKRYPVL